MRKLLIGFGAIAVIGFMLGVLVVPHLSPSLGDPVSFGDTARDYDEAGKLVQDSDRIVFARYLGETSHVVGLLNAYDDSSVGDLTLMVQTFETVESFKGDSSVGDMTYVAVEAAESYDWSDGTNDIARVQLSEDEDYVIFLRPVPAWSEFNGQYGGSVWAYVGRPGIAQIQSGSGNLQFKATDEYKRHWDVLADSDAPFQLSKQGIIDLVSSGM